MSQVSNLQGSGLKRKWREMDRSKYIIWISLLTFEEPAYIWKLGAEKLTLGIGSINIKFRKQILWHVDDPHEGRGNEDD